MANKIIVPSDEAMFHPNSGGSSDSGNGINMKLSWVGCAIVSLVVLAVGYLVYKAGESKGKRFVISKD